jgi:transposase
MSRNLFWLTDQQWSRIEPHLPADVRGKDRADDRRVIRGIVHMCSRAVAGGVIAAHRSAKTNSGSCPRTQKESLALSSYRVY